MSITTLKTAVHTARKKHQCDFCRGPISPGEKYECSTLVYDGDLYQWKSHPECSTVASELDMYDYCDDEGVTHDDFVCSIDQYVYDECYDDEKDDIQEEFATKNYREKARLILKKLGKEIKDESHSKD